MILLDHLALFLRIVEKGGLAAAGREMGLSPASVTERLAGLERHYGATLLTRTTRSISLTDEGRLLVEGARRLLAETDDLEARIKQGIDKISGPIRMSAPNDLGRAHIVPVIDAFLDANPEVSIDLNLNDGYVDLIGQGLDFAVRHGLLADSTLHARSLGENRRVFCAAPAYLASHGTPQHPDELKHHQCLIMRFGQSPDQEWNFRIGGETRRYVIKGRRIANDGGLIRQWALEGRGIALKSIRDVGSDLASGALVEILADFAPGPTALQIVYPHGATQPRRVRMLIDHIAASLE